MKLNQQIHMIFFISFLNESMYGWKVLKLFNAPNKRVSNFKDIINYLYSLENIYKIH